MKPFTPPILAAAALLVGCEHAADPAGSASPTGGSLQADLTLEAEVPDWVGLLLNGPNLLLGDPASTQEELPGMGHKFQLLFAMVNAQDPQNTTNDVISVNVTATDIGVAVRNLPPGIKIDALTDQMHVKYFFPLQIPTRTCFGGSPRIQVAIDGDGDGRFNQFTGGPDQNAFGYVGHAPFGAGCITGDWDVIDMTDNIGRWDLSQFGGAMTFTWDQAVAFINSTKPNHRVISGSLVDDSGGFGVGGQGLAFYDLVTIENRTLENRQDTVK